MTTPPDCTGIDPATSLVGKYDFRPHPPATLSLEEAVEKAAKAICWQEHKGRTGIDSPEESWTAWHANYETLAEAALDSVNYPALLAQHAKLTDLARMVLALDDQPLGDAGVGALKDMATVALGEAA